MIYAILFALLPACPYEDGINCKWDASLQGNGQGTSFAVIGHRAAMASWTIYADGRTHYDADQ